MLMKDVIKLFGGTNLDIGGQDVVHIGPTYNYNNCNIGDNIEESKSNENDEPNKDKLISVAAIGAVAVGGMIAYNKRDSIGKGVCKLVDYAVKTHRVSYVCDGEDWVASMYIRTINATISARMVDTDFAAYVSPGKIKSNIAVGSSSDVEISISSKQVVAYHNYKNLLGNYKRIRTPNDTPICPDRLDGVCTPVGWVVLIQRNGKIWLGLVSSVNSKTMSSVDDSNRSKEFTLIQDIEEEVSRMK